MWIIVVWMGFAQPNEALKQAFPNASISGDPGIQLAVYSDPHEACALAEKFKGMVWEYYQSDYRKWHTEKRECKRRAGEWVLE